MTTFTVNSAYLQKHFGFKLGPRFQMKITSTNDVSLSDEKIQRIVTAMLPQLKLTPKDMDVNDRKKIDG